jgi:hypothetical protein
MSRDLLTIATRDTTAESPATHERPSAKELVKDLLTRVEREWSASRPQTETLWQLAGE